MPQIDLARKEMSIPAADEKRRDKRLPLTLPVKFTLGQAGDLTLLDGVTHNVSSGGVYFEAPIGQIAPSALLNIRIALPCNDEDTPRPTLVGTGIVRRVEPLRPEQVVGAWPHLRSREGIYGIAVQFQGRPVIQLCSLEQLLWEDGCS